MTYTVEDANGGSDTATLTVTGHPATTRPRRWRPDIGRVDSDETLTIAADDEGTVVNGVRERGGLLVNDSDTDGDTIRVWDVINYPADGSGAVRLTGAGGRLGDGAGAMSVAPSRFIPMVPGLLTRARTLPASAPPSSSRRRRTR